MSHSHAGGKSWRAQTKEMDLSGSEGLRLVEMQRAHGALSPAATEFQTTLS